MKLLNSLSLNMLANLNGTIDHKVLGLNEARELARVVGIESAVGHADTAAVLGSQLGVDVPMMRVTLSLSKGDQVLVGQYRGLRMPEGCKELPAGSTIEWVLVTVK